MDHPKMEKAYIKKEINLMNVKKKNKMNNWHNNINNKILKLFLIDF